MRTVVTFPRMGMYTHAFEKFFKTLGLDYIVPPPITKRTIEIGTEELDELMCYPAKTTLGNFTEAIEKGANTLVMFSTEGDCRFKNYYRMHELVLRKKKYQFRMCPLRKWSLLRDLKRIDRSITILKIIRAIRAAWNEVTILEKEDLEKNPSNPILKILITGEIYCVNENKVNMDLIKKLRDMNVYVDFSPKLSHFIRAPLYLTHFEKRGEKKEAREYLPHRKWGGHGFDTLYEILYHIKHEYDGVFHVYPFPCFTGDTGITIENYTSKPIKDIRIGERVLTHKGRFKKVTNNFIRPYNGEILNIDCGGLLNFDITPEHPVLLLKRQDITCRNKSKGLSDVCRPYKDSNNCNSNGTKCYKKEKMSFNPEFLPIKEARIGDFIAIPIPKEVKDKTHLTWNKLYKRKPKWEDIKKFKYSPELLRMIGYWLAEGNIQYDSGYSKKYKRALIFTFNSKEQDYLNDVSHIINRNFKVHIKKHYEKNNKCKLYIGNRNLADIIFHLCKEHCDGKEIHPDLMQLEPKLQLEIVKGFFRGDGCFTDKYGGTTYRGVTTSWKLANQLFWILIRNNIKATFMEQNIRGRKKSYMIKISNAEGIQRLNDEMIPIPKRNKKKHIIELKDYFLVPIRKIEKTEFNGEVYNLQVEEDNSYIANRLAAHNCMPNSTITKYIDLISEKYNDFPIQHLQCDEFSGEAGFDTRVEAFVDGLKFKKYGIDLHITDKEGYWLGIDIGSVSSKAAIIDKDNKVVASSYFLISGNPIEGVKKCLSGLPAHFKISGVGTTGSARYLVNEMVGADAVVNEVTAQTLGSLNYNREIKSIIEIGGLDSKCIIIKDGVPIWHNLNSKCAAGTGSFLMREAERINMPIEEFGDCALKSTMDINIASKCTVFAGQDCIHKAQIGFQKEDIAYGLDKGLVRNFINSTARNKKLEQPIIFNGGVAANKGVVQSFNEYFKSKIIVPEHHKIMGCIGAAISSKNAGKTKFKGFEVKDFKCESKSFQCSNCSNNCEIVELYQKDKLIYRTSGICRRWEV